MGVDLSQLLEVAIWQLCQMIWNSTYEAPSSAKVILIVIVIGEELQISNLESNDNFQLT